MISYSSLKLSAFRGMKILLSDDKIPGRQVHLYLNGCDLNDLSPAT